MKRRERCRAARMHAHLQLETLEQRQFLAADLLSGTALMEPADAGDTVQTARVSPLIMSTLRGVVIPTTRAPNRTIDGTHNNLSNPEWGSTNEQLLRVAAAEYGDGVWTPGGDDRPSARAISNALVDQDGENPNARGLSAFIYAWGQFIDHDIDLTGSPTENRETYPIVVPDGDEFFDPQGLGGQLIALTRSLYDPATGTGVGNPRQQINQITAWIDGSMVYGSDEVTADSLRTHIGGRLHVSAGNLPPTDADGNFLAGDIRANENVELTSMHTLFVREHNRWANQIARQNPRLSDEQIFQRARAIVIAEIQAITFNEFLPALLGRGAIDRYSGYDPTVDPSIANEFSTAAFRLHTFINDDVEFFGNDGRAVRDEITLAEAFFNPALFRETGADTILKYLASTHAQEFDNQIVGSLRNFLFGQPGQGGLDLASLNIQRGRDHGLADYNAVRVAYGLAPVDSFDDITSDAAVQSTLAALYDSVDNIDLWVGVLAEDRVRGAAVGELAQTIVADQFERLRDGDRFWYQRIFSGESLRRIENTSLSDIIRRNTSVSNLQENVFFLHAEVGGTVYLDADGNGGLGRREVGIRGVTVELLNDEGDVIATTTTNRYGRFKFTEFHETGDFQVRVVVPNGYRGTGETLREVLISRGDVEIGGINFGLRPLRNATSLGTRQVEALDAAFTDAAVETTSRFGRRR
jgi:peroxidase